MWNSDVEIAFCRPERARWTTSSGTARATRSIFVHEGRGTLETIFGDVPYKDGDYLVIPRGTTYRFMPEGEQRYLVFETPGLIEIPRRYRNQYGQILEGAPYYHRDIHPPTDLHTRRERGEFLVKVRVRGGYQEYVLDYHPFDVVGWDGFLYPWTFSIHDFEPITGRIHQPPPSHQTFQGQNFVICSFCPRKLDFDPEAVPIPYHHSNLQSEEMIYYVSGNFGSRKGISVGCDHAASVGAPARAAAGARGEVARRRGDDGARSDVRHVPSSQALDVRARPRRRPLRVLVVRATLGRAEPRRRDEPPVGMDADRFLAELPQLFDDYPRSEHPIDRRFAADRRRGREPRAREQPRAAQPRCRAASKERRHTSRSACSTALASSRRCSATSESGSSESTASRSGMRRSRRCTRISRGIGLDPPELIVGDAFELVPGGALGDLAIGVWYYDAAHSYEAQVEGLRIAEPLLVPGALVIVDDTDWDDVARAMDDYLAQQPRARRILTIDGKSRGAPQWWEGMQVLVWDG